MINIDNVTSFFSKRFGKQNEQLKRPPLQEELREHAERVLQKITKFAQTHDLEIRYLESNGKKILLLDNEDSPSLDTSKYFMELNNNRYANKNAHCKHTVITAIDSSTTDNGVITYDKDVDFQFQAVHALNIDTSGTGVVAIDFTAGTGVDANQGHFDALAFRAVDLHTALTYLHELYGGDWKMLNENELSLYREFVKRDSEMRSKKESATPSDLGTSLRNRN